MRIFNDRIDAGQQLSARLSCYKDQTNTIILALPRGGVPVAFEVAKMLHLPMTVFLVRKLGVIGQEELAMGAVAEGGICFRNQELIDQLGITEQKIHFVLNKEKQELNRRLQYYRQGCPLPALKNKTIILIDDGIATGATFKAVIMALKNLKPKKIILAVPVASSDSLQETSLLVDETVCLITPEPFYGVGQWYKYFDQTTDDEVLNLLKAVPVQLDFEENKS